MAHVSIGPTDLPTQDVDAPLSKSGSLGFGRTPDQAVLSTQIDVGESPLASFHSVFVETSQRNVSRWI